MDNFEQKGEMESTEPTAEEIYDAIRGEIPEEDLAPMKEECGDDLEMLLGAIFSYMIEIKGMSEDEAETYLTEKGIFE